MDSPVQPEPSSAIAAVLTSDALQRYLRSHLRDAIPHAGRTIHSVQAYRIERVKSGMKFTCAHCTYNVSTLDFDAKIGNLRTQAATAINLHAAKTHPEPAPPLYDQQGNWR